MTEASASYITRFFALWHYWHRTQSVLSPIVPQGDVRSTALAVVIGIMSFLACLALIFVNVIATAASDWEGEVSREATVQIRQIPGEDIEQALVQALGLVENFPGIAEAHILGAEETTQLLEPWLGENIVMADLPIPRLIIVRFEENLLPDVESLRALLQQNIPGSSFDDHRLWVDRLVGMARTMVLFGVGIFFLTLTAMILSVVFATRATLLNNAHIIEVLHFIGADAVFVARQFDWHFLRAGLKGAAFGDAMALFLFWLVQWWSQYNLAMPEGGQFSLLFGSFSFHFANVVEIAVLVIFVALLTMFTSRSTVFRQLREIDQHEANFLDRSG